MSHCGERVAAAGCVVERRADQPPVEQPLHDQPRLHDVPAEQPAEIHRTSLRVTQELLAVDCRVGAQGGKFVA
jgi:hypothetical protein